MPLSPRLAGFGSLLASAATCLLLCPVALAGDPATSIKINEVESDGGVDFIELTNISGTATDVSGLVLRDSTASSIALAGGTSIAAGGFLAIDTEPAFGLGGNDTARVFMPDGTTLINSYSWTAHAATTYGRCPDGTGAFITTTGVTKGAANGCPAPLPAWPGGASVLLADEASVLGPDVSGLDYEGSGTTAPGVLWAVDNGDGSMHRLVFDGAHWVRDTANGWSAGKKLRYPGGGGTLVFPDSEGVTLTDAGSAGGVYVSSERSSANNAASRPSILYYDVSGAGTELVATQEWNLTADLPAVAPNAGTESVEWVPDSALVKAGFVDQNTNEPYTPASYPDHGRGLFFVGLEGTGDVFAYALNHAEGTVSRVASFASGFSTFGALHWEAATEQLWVVCDNNCDGASRVFEVGPEGSFALASTYARPEAMPNLNNEGFTTAADSECVNGLKPVFWADDGNTGGHVLRAGTFRCAPQAASGAGWSGGSASVRGDFNGDGFGDLAVGSPGENVGGGEGAGMVQVLYGSASGVTGTGATRWSQDSVGIDGAAEAGDAFGSALAVGDFNGDGRADLAIGAPGENDGAGQVHVLRGSASGISAASDQIFSQNSANVGDATEAGDDFGATLAAGRFDDAVDDLAIGVPGEDLGGAADAGVVQVLPGSISGVTGTGSRTWSQASGGIGHTPEAADRFGLTLAAGNLNDGGQDELVIGVPGESTSTLAEIGQVHVLPGSASGLTGTGSQAWTQNSGGVADASEAYDRFGSALVVADLGGTTTGDLAIGVPGEDVGSAADAGIVQILRGASAGPTAAGSQTFGEDTTGVTGTAERSDAFGAALAAANLGGSAEAELIAGSPGESSGTLANIGVVHVLPGSASGTTATGSQVWSQNSSGIADQTEAGDRFGSTLTASRYTAATSDLVIGVPDEDFGAQDSGVAHFLRGAGGSPGLTATGSKLLSQATGGGAAQAGDRFGGGLGR